MPYEFQRKFQDYLGAYNLADKWERSDSLQWFTRALRRLGYFSVTRSEVSPKNNPMVEVKGQFSLAKRLPELVQIDLLNVWRDAVQNSEHVCHSFEVNKSGIQAHFLAVFDSTIITFQLDVYGTH